jgi:glycerol-3-phosphate O-acyltransferase/dihydroxyacetone phosphate acyltransferase
MQKLISSGTIDSPSWELVRIATLANRMYAPLGTRMTLGDYVRGIRSFVDALKPPKQAESGTTDQESSGGEETSSSVTGNAEEHAKLRNDLKVRGIL